LYSCELSIDWKILKRFKLCIVQGERVDHVEFIKEFLVFCLEGFNLHLVKDEVGILNGFIEESDLPAQYHYHPRPSCSILIP
jgi:hypothetical protein